MHPLAPTVNSSNYNFYTESEVDILYCSDEVIVAYSNLPKIGGNSFPQYFLLNLYLGSAQQCFVALLKKPQLTIISSCPHKEIRSLKQ